MSARLSSSDLPAQPSSSLLPLLPPSPPLGLLLLLHPPAPLSLPSPSPSSLLAPPRSLPPNPEQVYFELLGRTWPAAILDMMTLDEYIAVHLYEFERFRRYILPLCRWVDKAAAAGCLARTLLHVLYTQLPVHGAPSFIPPEVLIRCLFRDPSTMSKRMFCTAATYHRACLALSPSRHEKQCAVRRAASRSRASRLSWTSRACR